MKTFAYIRTLHWLTVGLQLKEHFSLQNRHLQLVGSRSLLSELMSLGLRMGEDLASFTDCQNEVRQAKHGEVGILLHHHEKAAADLALMLGEESAHKDVILSFYADGYNNQLLHADHVRKFVENNALVRPGDIFFFDIAESAIPKHLERFKVVVVLSDTLSLIAGLPALQDKAQVAVAGSVERAMGRKLLLLMLRPWGSAGFHGGKLAVQAPAQKLAQGMASLVSRIEEDIGEPVCVAIRPDSRDPALMADFMRAFKALIGPRGFDINEFWPARLTMEPFIYNFAHFAPNTHLSVACLDSTASLPFLRLGKGDRHYLGAPDAILEALLDRAEAAEATRVKIRRVERHAATLAKSNLLTLTRLEPQFARAVPRSSKDAPRAEH
jgi:hypothetical protein